jgi:enoyl-CoA hydratase/carnithine racemase
VEKVRIAAAPFAGTDHLQHLIPSSKAKAMMNSGDQLLELSVQE